MPSRLAGTVNVTLVTAPAANRTRWKGELPVRLSHRGLSGGALHLLVPIRRHHAATLLGRALFMLVVAVAAGEGWSCRR